MRDLNRQDFLNSPAGVQATRELQQMVSSSKYSTNEAYITQVNRTSKFVERHIDYLIKHPNVSPVAYVSNLRVMLKANR